MSRNSFISDSCKLVICVLSNFKKDIGDRFGDRGMGGRARGPRGVGLLLREGEKGTGIAMCLARMQHVVAAMCCIGAMRRALRCRFASLGRRHLTCAAEDCASKLGKKSPLEK